jgi:AcrR family transcriptional regulator
MQPPPDATAKAEGASGRGRITRDERREALLDMAAQLVVTESADAVTMELVAERCGVSRPLVYKHFANRDELLGVLYRREARRLDAELAGEVGAATDVEGMFRALVHGALRAAAERSHLFVTLRSIGGANREVRVEQRARDDRTFRAFARRSVDELGLDPRLGPAAISLLLSLIDPVLNQWRHDPTPEHARLLEDSYMAIVTATLRELSEAQPPA